MIQPCFEKPQSSVISKCDQLQSSQLLAYHLPYIFAPCTVNSRHNKVEYNAISVIMNTVFDPGQNVHIPMGRVSVKTKSLGTNFCFNKKFCESSCKKSLLMTHL